jgi:hypothetical protein
MKCIMGIRCLFLHFIHRITRQIITKVGNEGLFWKLSCEFILGSYQYGVIQIEDSSLWDVMLRYSDKQPRHCLM